MKKLTPFQKKVAQWCVLIFFLALMPVRCGPNSLPPISSKQTTSFLLFSVIEYQPSEHHYPAERLYGKCPVIAIGCKSAILDKANRRIIVDGADRIAVSYAKNSALRPIGWLADIKIEESKLVFELYPNCSYAIYINNDYHKLPLLKN